MWSTSGSQVRVTKEGTDVAEETEEKKGQAFLDKFAEVSARIGNQIHLRTLRDAFATVMPIYILSGIAVLINNVLFPLFWAADSPQLKAMQV